MASMIGREEKSEALHTRNKPFKNYLLKKRGFQDKNAAIQKMIEFLHLPTHSTPLGTPDFGGDPAETIQGAVNYDLSPCAAGSLSKCLGCAQRSWE